MAGRTFANLLIIHHELCREGRRKERSNRSPLIKGRELNLSQVTEKLF